MDKKIIAGIVIACSVIAGLFIGLSDGSYIKVETNSDKLISKNSGDVLSGENPSGNALFSGDSSGDIITPDEPVTPPESDSPIIDTSHSSPSTQSSSKQIPESVKAVYATGWVMGSKGPRDSMITLIKENGYNAVVIDIKDEAGQLSYNSSVQTAIDINASRKMISNVEAVIKELKENDIYVIGRIVTFKDPIYASKVNSIAYKKSDGSIWKDSAGNCWPNPYNRETWKYPLELAKEAAKLGFEEIQFDYIRFPSSEGKVSNISYGFDYGTTKKADIISSFLEEAMKELAPYNVVVSADVFGITTKRDGDFENIGQDFSRIAGIVDVICPMVYPSHYYYNEYKIAVPDKNPYEIVYYSLEDAFERIESYISGDTTKKVAKIRPYFQDFTATWLGKGNYIVYGTEEVKKQIQASYDLGIKDFCLWDPSNKYCYPALKQVKEN